MGTFGFEDHDAGFVADYLDRFWSGPIAKHCAARPERRWHKTDDPSAASGSSFGDARSAALQREVDAAVAHGRPAVIHLNGTYNFSRASLVLLGANQLTLQGAPGTLLLFSVWRVRCTVIGTGGPCHGAASADDDPPGVDDCCATETCGPGTDCVNWSSGVNITSSVGVTVRRIAIDYDPRWVNAKEARSLAARAGSGAAFNAGRLFT